MSIAVLLPSYKPAWYLERCLESIEHQTLERSRFKVYLALNGPKEEYEVFALNLLGKFSFNYEYFYVEEAGVSNARNILLEMSSEDYVTFVDDDDLISPNYLEELIRHASDEYISVSNVFSFTESIHSLRENYIGKSFSMLKDCEISLFKSRKFFSSPWAKLIHRKIVGSARFDTKLKVGEDSLFMAELSRRVKGVRKTNETACYYVYKREGSASRKKTVRTEEIRRVLYLVAIYGKMLLTGYNPPFILSRVAASLMHFKRIF